MAQKPLERLGIFGKGERQRRTSVCLGERNPVQASLSSEMKDGGAANRPTQPSSTRFNSRHPAVPIAAHSLTSTSTVGELTLRSSWLTYSRVIRERDATASCVSLARCQALRSSSPSTPRKLAVDTRHVCEVNFAKWPWPATPRRLTSARCAGGGIAAPATRRSLPRLAPNACSRRPRHGFAPGGSPPQRSPRTNTLPRPDVADRERQATERLKAKATRRRADEEAERAKSAGRVERQRLRAE